MITWRHNRRVVSARWIAADVLQIKPSHWAVVPLHPAAGRVFVHQLRHTFTDPRYVLGHLGVDTVLALASAAFTPAHNASDEVGAMVTCDMRPTAVTLAGVLGFCVIAGAEHPGRDAQRSGLDTGPTVHVGHGEALQDGRWLTTLAKTSKTADHAIRFLHQDLKEEVRCLSAASSCSSV